MSTSGRGLRRRSTRLMRGLAGWDHSTRSLLDGVHIRAHPWPRHGAEGAQRCTWIGPPYLPRLSCILNAMADVERPCIAKPVKDGRMSWPGSGLNLNERCREGASKRLRRGQGAR